VDARKTFDEQKRHWQDVYETNPDKFGQSPSSAALLAHELFAARGVKTALELGCGAGRDTLFFLQQGLRVTAADYATRAIKALAERASGISSGQLSVVEHDVRLPLPFAGRSFDACYSHMLLCMALTTKEIEGILLEIWRVLKPGGL